MRVALTGASGLIGSALRRELEARGDDVVVLLRPGATTSARDTLSWDPSAGRVDESALARLGHLDALVHLAGAGIGDRRWNDARKREILDSRVRSTQLLVELVATKRMNVDYVASASAVGWYGSRADEVLDEESAPGTGFLADVCAAWEDATEPLVNAGVPVAHFRSGVVLSRDGGALVAQLPLFRFGLGGRLGTGRQWMSPISLSDEVRAITWLLDRRLRGTVNLVGPAPCTNRTFTRALARALKRPAAFAMPAVALRAALGAEMAQELVLTSQRVVPRVLEASGFEYAHVDVESMLTHALK